MKYLWMLTAVLGAGALCAQAKPVPQAPTAREQVTVTATRSVLDADSSGRSVRVVQQQALQESPSFLLDDRLRAVPGLELYRRTASWLANPTTQGISLRGLGSTAVSRTLVLSDEVPLSDPFGGWIHWNEIPAPALERVEVVRGGGSDLYGSSAIGGVINAVPSQATSRRAEGSLSGGAMHTFLGNGLLSDVWKHYGALGAAEVLRTDGYVPLAPESRGAVDRPAGVNSESGRVELRYSTLQRSAFLRGNGLNETRQNGTLLQNNGTRLWRYQGGADAQIGAQHVLARLYGSRQTYRQTFSSINAARTAENLTRVQRVPTDELGFAAQWSRAWKHMALVAGADLRDIRATDDETPVSSGVYGTRQQVSARQRATGGFGELLWTQGAWSVALSGRVDDFRTMDAVRWTGAVRSVPGAPQEALLSPRIGVVRTLPRGFALHASGFRAFRGPTMNELYRSFQVGQQVTQANDGLLAERATGWEAGGEKKSAKTSVRASYFWTVVNRPVSSILVSQTSTSQTMRRVNLGQIRSRGVSVDFDSALTRWMQVSGGYQFARATVTSFDAETSLVGNWLPEVARNTATLQVRLSDAKWGTLNVIARQSGRAFDDAENTELLHGYFRADVHAEHRVGAYVDGYVDVQNLFDRRIDAGRTPLLSLGTPQVVTIGLRLHGHR